MADQDTPIEGQDVESLAKSLFSEDLDIPEDNTGSNPDNVDPQQQQQQAVQQQEPQQQQQQQQAAPQQQQQQVQPIVLDAEKMKQFEEWQKTLGQPTPGAQAPVQQVQQQPVQQQQVQQQPVPQQLPPEQVDKMLNKFTLTQKEYDAIFKTDSEEKSIEALNNVLQATVRQAVTMAFHLVQDTEQRVAQTVTPYIKFADTQRELMLRETFFNDHPDLRGAEPVINAVMVQMAQSGQKYQDQKQLFDAVAKSTKDQLAQLGLVQGQGQQPKPTTRKQPMAVLPTGGQGGRQESANAGQSRESNTARNIFG